MRRVAATLAAMAVVLAGCGTDEHDNADTHSIHDAHPSSASTSTKSTQKVPPIAKECVDHPLANPAAPGEPYCHPLYVLETLNVAYDVPAGEAEENWPYDPPDDPVWMIVDFKATSIKGPPPVWTDDALPTMTDVNGQMMRVGAVIGESQAIPSYDSIEFQAVYTFERTEADRSMILLCADFLSSPSKSSGCAHI